MGQKSHIATLSVVLVGLLFILALRFDSEPWSPWLLAFAEAGLVGALADWFAVVALFKRPLGLPIPHTGVLARERNRIGRALGIFVAQSLLTEETTKKFIHSKDPIGLIQLHLKDPILRNRFFSKWLPGSITGESMKPFLLKLIKEEDRIEWLLVHLKEWFSNNRQIFKSTVNLPWYVPPFVGSLLTEKLYEQSQKILYECMNNADHPLRSELEKIIEEGVSKIANEPQLLNNLFEKLCYILSDALNAHHEVVEKFIDSLAMRIARSVAEDLPDLSEGVFKRWPEREFTEKLEVMVKDDLNWIRVNGALVGGFIGLFLYALKLYIGAA